MIDPNNGQPVQGTTNTLQNTPTPQVPTPIPETRESFDIDSALKHIETATPTPEPTIKVNPRNVQAVQENHHEDISNGVHNTQKPIPTHVTESLANQQKKPTPTAIRPATIAPTQAVAAIPAQTPTTQNIQTQNTTQQPQMQQSQTPTPVPTSPTPAKVAITKAFAETTPPAAVTPIEQTQTTQPTIQPTISTQAKQNIPNIQKTPNSPAVQPKQNISATPATPSTPATPPSPTMPITPPSPNTPARPTKANIVKTKKKGTRIGFKGFAIGCLVLLLFIIGGGGLLLRSMFQDVNQTRTIIPRASAEILLKIFAGVIFISLTLFGTFFVFVNIFRIATKKNTKKIGYIMGIFLGIVLLVFGLGGGVRAMNRLSNISGETENSENLAIPGIINGTKGWTRLGGNEQVRAIAPVKIQYKLNMNEYKAFKGRKGIQGEIVIELSCGNGQSFPVQVNKRDGQYYFGPCFYTKKGNYPTEISLTYTDRSTGQTMTEKQPFMMNGNSGFAIGSEIEIKALDGTQMKDLITNEKQTEIVAGEAPAKVSFNAQKLVSNIGLTTNAISWDVDGDGVFERKEDVVFSKNFIKSKLHYISYRIGNEETIYKIPLRVEQSNVPICTVEVEASQAMTYDIETKFIESNATISQYMFEIIDREKNKKIDRVQSGINNISYDFTKEGMYSIKTYFITTDGSKGTCQSQDFRVGSVPYIIDHDITLQGPREEEAKDIEESDIITTEGNVWTITQIPTKVSLSINDIRPRSKTIRPLVTFDGKTSVSADDKTFNLNIKKPGKHTIKIGVRDESSDEVTIIKTYDIIVDLPVAQGFITISPDNVGHEPFETTLDASSVTINDPDDEIIYFSWDFGDGEIKTNQNQGTIEHIYHFDSEKGKGVYKPTVTITTRKGQEVVIKTKEPITIKRALRNATINLDSHPGQLARVGENVTMSLTANNIPSKIARTFGDGETFECNGRSCSEMQHQFKEEGTYKISAKISYNDYPDIITKTKIIVR